MPLDSSSLRVHLDASNGSGRAMACRPDGACPPERVDHGWDANRGARRTRVSEMRASLRGRAVDRPDHRAFGTRAPSTTYQRGMAIG